MIVLGAAAPMLLLLVLFAQGAVESGGAKGLGLAAVLLLVPLAAMGLPWFAGAALVRRKP